jgi:imidazolonepropionase-like amidohydrolase
MPLFTTNDTPAPRTPRRILLAAVAALAASAQAQDLGVKAAPQTQPIVITGATIHPISGEPIENGFIAFEKGRITAVGSGSPDRTQGARVIDAKGKHVYPGLIAADTQLGLAELAAVRAMNDYSEFGGVTPEVRAIVAVNPDSTLLPVTRSNGILTVAVAPSGGRIPGRMGVMRLDGWTWEEMAIEPDAGLCISWPAMRTFNAPWMTQSEDEQREQSRTAYQAIDDTFKAAEAYIKAKDADPTHPTDLRWEAMRSILGGAAVPAANAGKSPASPSQKPVFITAADVDQITAAVTWALGKKLRPVIVGGRDAEQCADLLKRHDIPVIITGTHAFPKRDDSPYDDAFTLPARLHAAGVKFAIASADRTAHERNLPYNAATAVAYGLDHDAALKSITQWPAEILGIADRLGTLETGKSATLIVTNGDPLEVTTSPSMAFIDGREIDLSNKQTILAEKYREKYRQKNASSETRVSSEKKDAKATP